MPIEHCDELLGGAWCWELDDDDAAPSDAAAPAEPSGDPRDELAA